MIVGDRVIVNDNYPSDKTSVKRIGKLGTITALPDKIFEYYNVRIDGEDGVGLFMSSEIDLVKEPELKFNVGDKVKVTESITTGKMGDLEYTNIKSWVGFIDRTDIGLIHLRGTVDSFSIGRVEIELIEAAPKRKTKAGEIWSAPPDFGRIDEYLILSDTQVMHVRSKIVYGQDEQYRAAWKFVRDAVL